MIVLDSLYINNKIFNFRVTSAVRQVAFSTHARFFVSCHDDGTVMTWEINSRNAFPKTMKSDVVPNKEQNIDDNP